MYPTHQLSGLRSQASGLLTALVILCTVTGCLSRSTAWPTPQITYTHAANRDQADRLLKQWTSLSGCVWGYANRTGSMLPYIHGGLRERLLYETYRGQPIKPGLVVAYRRNERVVQYDSMGILVAAHDRPEWGAEVLHLVVAVSADGRHMLVTGTNTKSSDGWQPVKNTTRILRQIITLPAL